MKICFVTKYPPIQGGVSMRCYWMAREMAARGHQISVVTNANEVESEYRILMTNDDADWYAPRFPRTGGSVSVTTTLPMSDALHHIPFSNPFVSKLASLATDVIRRDSCESIFSYYLQPYGVASYLASQWTEVPFMVRHAGSDLGRLMKSPGLRTAYAEILRRANCVCTGSTPEPFIAMGVPEDNVWPLRGFPLPTIFSEEATPIELAKYIASLATAARAEGLPPVNSQTFDASLPTIGLYGKVGATKGSLDLVHALAQLKQKGVRFNFVAISNGRHVAAFRELVHKLGLDDCTWILPFVPHWRIPGFIRACTCICFLERDFPISFHGPTIPREVLACGACLVLSQEVAARQSFCDRIVHGEHMLVVETPRDHARLAAELARVVQKPDWAAAVGRAGHRLYAEDNLTDGWNALLTSFEDRLESMRRPSKTRTAARIDRLAERLPLTKVALGARWAHSVDDYCKAIERPSSIFLDALQFAQVIATSPQDSAPTIAVNLARYEGAHNRTFVDAQKYDCLRAFGHLSRGMSNIVSNIRALLSDNRTSELMELVPQLSPHVTVEEFDFDMRALCADLLAGTVGSQTPIARTALLFASEPNFMCQEYEIDTPTLRLLGVCDGTRTLADVVHFVRRDFPDLNPEVVSAEIIQVLRSLGTKGLVEFSTCRLVATG